MQLTPAWRLALRALLAGVAAFVQQLQATDHLDRAIVVAALISAGWAFAEYLLPFLNASVGPGKNAPPSGKDVPK